MKKVYLLIPLLVIIVASVILIRNNNSKSYLTFLKSLDYPEYVTPNYNPSSSCLGCNDDRYVVYTFDKKVSPTQVIKDLKNSYDSRGFTEASIKPDDDKHLVLKYKTGDESCAYIFVRNVGDWVSLSCGFVE